MANEIGELHSVDWEGPVEAIEKCYELGWTDGLPVVPPTSERVQQFLDYAQRPAEEVIGSLPERRREVTVGKVAANAVLAGCLPEYFPVVLAATEAMLAPEFNLIGPSSSLGGAAVLVIVNGPVVRELNINARNNLFGPGNRANSTIGRSIRLILMNACAAIPGLFDRSILGHPGKFSFCIAENESGNHWNPLHLERGFAADQSAVTVFACGAPRQVSTPGGPEAAVSTVAEAILAPSTSISSMVSPDETVPKVGQGEVAVVVAGRTSTWAEWSKEDFRKVLQSKLRRSVADLKRAGQVEGNVEPKDENRFRPLALAPEDILVVLAGGDESQMCAFIPPWGPKVSSTSVTKAITIPSR